MAVFIELTTDAFEKRFKIESKGRRASGDTNKTSRAGRRIARRPVRGIEIKTDTYAMLKVVTATGEQIPLYDSSSPHGETKTGYTNFLLQAVQEQRAEKHQLVETFGDAYIFFFGENPRFLDCKALLINTHDFNWRAEWWHNYNTYLRGTRLAELGARVYLFYDDIIVEGYLLTAQASESADQPYMVTLDFRLFVTNYSNLSIIDPPDNAAFPTRSSAEIPAGVDLTSSTAAADAYLALFGDPDDGTISESIRQAAEQAALVGSSEDATLSRNLFRRPDFIDLDGSITQPNGRPVQGEFSTKTQDIVYRQGNPLRGKVAENYDEFVGVYNNAGEYNYHDNIESSLRSAMQEKFDVDDLHLQVIYSCSCYGANVDSPSTLAALGLAPGKGTARSLASFSAASSDVASDRKAGGAATSSLVTTPGLGGRADPLGKVFGTPEGDVSDFSKAQKFEEGRGDYKYGYRSGYAGGPGYGGAGFGDMGGGGYGAGVGESGDPGFKDPALFTSKGVSEAEAAYSRFIAPVEDNTALTAGGSVGTGTSGGASVSVGGNPTAFALVSVDGELDTTGQSRKVLGIATGATPYGVRCPNVSGTTYSLP